MQYMQINFQPIFVSQILHVLFTPYMLIKLDAGDCGSERQVSSGPLACSLSVISSSSHHFVVFVVQNNM